MGPAQLVSSAHGLQLWHKKLSMTRPKAKGYWSGILPPWRETWRQLYKSKRGTALEVSGAGQKCLSLIVQLVMVTASQPITIQHASFHVGYSHVSQNVYLWRIPTMHMLFFCNWSKEIWFNKIIVHLSFIPPTTVTTNAANTSGIRLV